MGKVDKKNKNKKLLVKKFEDFKKVKSKVGRKLKRLNETLPRVITSKVVLKSQFTERKIKIELYNLKNSISDGTLTVSRLNELHETIMLTLRKSHTGRSSERKDSLIMTRELLKSVAHDSGAEIYIRSTSDLLDLICPLMVDAEHDVRLETSRLFQMVMSNPLMKLSSSQSHPIVSSNILRALSNQAAGEDAMLLVDVMLEHNPLFILSISNKLIGAMLNHLQKQSCTKSQSSMYVDKFHHHLNVPNQIKRNKIDIIGRLQKIFSVLICELQRQNYLYYHALFCDNILDDDVTCVDAATKTVGILLQCLKDILLPVPQQNYCFDSLTCDLLSMCLSATNVIFNFVSLAVRSTASLVTLIRENFEKQFYELTKNFPLIVSQKISKRGKWTGVERDRSVSINQSISQINNYIQQFSTQ